jgi:hypothetical protein
MTLATLPTFQVSARPIEPDFPCYMRTSAGKLVDLTASMCGGGRLVMTPLSGSTTLSDGATAPDDDVKYNPRYRATNRKVRTTTGGGSVTTTTTGGVIDDTLYGRDGVSDNVGSRGQCNTPDDRYTLRDGSTRRCGGTAASERPGGR